MPQDLANSIHRLKLDDAKTFLANHGKPVSDEYSDEAVQLALDQVRSSAQVAANEAEYLMKALARDKKNQ